MAKHSSVTENMAKSARSQIQSPGHSSNKKKATDHIEWEKKNALICLHRSLQDTALQMQCTGPDKFFLPAPGA